LLFGAPQLPKDVLVGAGFLRNKAAMLKATGLEITSIYYHPKHLIQQKVEDRSMTSYNNVSLLHFLLRYS
jgi:hypothetical protein